jgi:hypothetical protein
MFAPPDYRAVKPLFSRRITPALGLTRHSWC